MRTPIHLNLTETRNIRWVEYVLMAALIGFTVSSNAATYYWVGGTGNWHDLSKWAAVSGGPGNAFSQPPSIGDHVVFDRKSFTAAGQVVSCTTLTPNPACANLDWSDATAIYGGSSSSPTFNLSTNLSVSGNIIMPASMKFTNNGNMILEGGGNKTINFPATISGTGSIQVHHVNGTWTMQSALNFPNGRLHINKGVFNTNSRAITLRYFISEGSDPRQINLGSSHVQIRPISANNMAFWNITCSAGITFNAGTSEIEIVSSTNNLKVIFNGQGLTYHNLTVSLPNGSPGSTTTYNNITINGNNTFNRVTFTRGTALFNDDNTFLSSLKLCNGHRYRFRFGTTQTFTSTASFNTFATQASPIYIQSTSSSNFATFTKPSGVVCTDHVFISMIRATGGASWNSASTNFNQSPNFISGWNFGTSGANIHATIQGGVKCKGEPFNLKLTFSGATFPVTCVLQNMLTGQMDTIENIVSSVYYHPVNPLTSTIYRIAQVSSSGCFTTVANFNVQDLVTVPLYGRLATWLGLRSSDWYDCYNWSNNAVPEDTVDVLIQPNQLMTQPVIATGVASTKQIEIAYDADLTLFGSNTELHVFGNFINNGTFNPNDAKVAFIGNNVSSISGGEYGTLVINNTTPEGIALTDTVVVSGTLTLNNGVVNTNGNLIKITNPSPAAITNYGEDNYINGVLERAISDSGTYSFPVGDDVIYALCEVRATGSTGGVQNLRVQFIHKPGTDDGMNLEFNGVQINSVHPAGIWLIEPDQQPVFGGGVSGDYELTFHLNGFPNLSNYNLYILTRHDTSTNAADWTVAGIQSGNQVTDGKITVSGITHFSQWGVGEGGGSSLPVKLTEFKATAVDNKFIQLKWLTQTEIDNKGFMVERSLDGEEFNTIGFVPGYGNSTETHSYVYNDKNVEPKKRYYYRLKQIDYDGGSEYTKVVSAILNYDKTHRIGEFIPNPTSNVANVEIYSQFDEKVTFEFQNTAGQVVKKGDVMLKKGNHSYMLDVNDLPAGNYIVTINTPQQVYSKKLVVKN